MTSFVFDGLDDRNTDALSFMAIAWDDLDDDQKPQVLAQMFLSLSPSDRDLFDNLTEREETDAATRRFISLIAEHEDDESYITPELGAGWDGDSLFIPYENAWYLLCKEQGENWAKRHDWEFGATENEYDVRVYIKQTP